MIGILDYGGGNIRSVENALTRIGVEFFTSADPGTLKNAEKILFPGQGRCGDVLTSLKNRKLDIFLKNLTKPFLGICVGMQLLFEDIEEDDVKGLGIISGSVKKFDLEKVPCVPHMGWNEVNYELRMRNEELDTNHTSFFNISNNSDFYFVHSYYCDPQDSNMSLSETLYGEQKLCSSVQKDNFIGVQFHPEKSGKAGEDVLRNFCL